MGGVIALIGMIEAIRVTCAWVGSTYAMLSVVAMMALYFTPVLPLASPPSALALFPAALTSVGERAVLEPLQEEIC